MNGTSLEANVGYGKITQTDHLRTSTALTRPSDTFRIQLGGQLPGIRAQGWGRKYDHRCGNVLGRTIIRSKPRPSGSRRDETKIHGVFFWYNDDRAAGFLTQVVPGVTGRRRQGIDHWPISVGGQHSQRHSNKQRASATIRPRSKGRLSPISQRPLPHTAPFKSDFKYDYDSTAPQHHRRPSWCSPCTRFSQEVQLLSPGQFGHQVGWSAPIISRVRRSTTPDILRGLGIAPV